MLEFVLFLLAAGSAPALPALGPVERTPSTPAVDPSAPLVSAGGDTVIYSPAYFASSRPSTALDMVQLVPGFVIQGGSAGRGLEGSATNVLIDGHQVPGKGEGVARALARIPATSVVAVIQIRGAQPGIDMGGYAEVVNILRFPRSESGGVVTLSTGRSARSTTQALSLSGTTGRPGRAFSGSINQSDSHGGTRSQRVIEGSTPLALESTSDSQSRTATAATDLAVGGATTLRAEISGSASSFASKQTQRGEPAASVDSLSLADARSRKLSVRIDQMLGAAVFASLDTVHSDGESQSDSRARSALGQSRFLSTTANGETAVGLTARWKPRVAWQVEGGVDYALNTLKSRALFGENSEPLPLPSGELEVSEQRVGAALKLGWSPPGAWSATARLRVNAARLTGGGAIDDTRTLREIKPELRLQGALGLAKLDFRLAREIDQLEFGAFTASAKLDDGTITLGNPQLDPIRRWLLVTTLHRPLFGEAELSVSARAERIDNPTEVIRTGEGFDLQDNIGTAATARLNAQLRLPLDDLGLRGARLDLSQSVGASRVTDPTTGELRRVSADSRSNWSASFRHHPPRSLLSYGINTGGARSAPSYRPDTIDQFVTKPSLTGYVEVSLSSNISFRAQASRSGGSRYERTLYAGDRTSGVVLERQSQETAPSAGGQITLRVDL